MPDPSYISKGVLASLALVSGGTCYWPEPRCLVPVTVNIGRDVVLNLEVAHIRGAHENGPRYVKEMSDIERRQFGNLLLLCPSHHRYVDVLYKDEFGIDDLEQWKRNREGESYQQLRTVPVDFTEQISPEDALQAIFSDAIREQTRELERQVTKFENALNRLEAIDHEAASQIRERLQSAEMLHDAARMLARTGDTVEMLHGAARMLSQTDNTAEILFAASQQLRNFIPAAEVLIHASDQFGRLRLTETAEMLWNAARLLAPVISSTETIAQATARLSGAAADLVDADHVLASRIATLSQLRDIL